MKKVKLNVDKEAIRLFFVEHTEKVVFGVVVVCFLLIVYKAFARPGFDRTPNDLTNSAERASQHISDTDPPDDPNAGAIFDVKLPKVDASAYKHENLWIPVIFEPPGGAKNPNYFPIVGLRGVAGMGAFQVQGTTTPAAEGAAPTTGKTRQGRHYVVLTGKIPHRQQSTEYEACLTQSRNYDPAKLVPAYRFYYIERADVTGQPATSAPNWEKLNPKAATDFKAQWASSETDVVALKYLIADEILLFEKLAFALGPLVKRRPGAPTISKKKSPWGEEVAYPPDIPLMSQGRPETTTTPVNQPVDEPGFDDFSGDPMMEEPVGHSEQQPVVAAANDGLPEFKLFRAFDFSVEPGRAYVYQVQLRLINPNKDAADRFLDPETLALKQEYEQLAKQQEQDGDAGQANRTRWEWQFPRTDWSEPTEIVHTSRDSRLLAVSVTPPKPTAEPACRMLVVKWVKEKGQNAHEEFNVVRGQVLNFPSRTFDDPSGAMTVDYMTETMVLDMQAVSLTRNEAGPGEILLMDENGNLTLHNELDDRAKYNEYTSESAEPETAPSAGQPHDMDPGKAAPVPL